jgi:hypothetical protein
MAVPIISTTTSILALVRGETYAIHLALADGSDPADTWHITSGGLPGGMELDEDTGRITGAPGPESEGSVLVASLIARNEDGDSAPIELVIGIEARVNLRLREILETGVDGGVVVEPLLPELMGVPEIGVDVQTGAVLSETGAPVPGEVPVLECRRGDRFPLALALWQGGRRIDLEVIEANFSVALYESEGALALDTGSVTTIGADDLARYLLTLDADHALLEAWLADEEDDAGTSVLLQAEIELRWYHLSEIMVRTTNPFRVRLHRDLRR